ncbi:MAG TPA: Holliday junction branch migration protein RuvA [Clostridiales bacterium]|nr:Holliday junction branch migration protein RuvA [Clostridiales bacterium]HQP69051.1 Holliday junction branch migration protein RuvA [Clostridiales bacterium]
MIEMLIGEVLYKEPGKVVINCGGVGYSAFISSFTYSSIAETGKIQKLFTFMKVREDDISLYGFVDKKEKDLFLTLSSISGIGSKTAIQLLSDIKYDRLYSAIATADVTLISQARGIGKKTAQKIVFELKDKIGKLDDLTAMEMISGLTADNSEAVTALVRLGYKNSDANSAVAKILKEKGKNISTQEIVKLALQERMKK